MISRVILKSNVRAMPAVPSVFQVGKCGAALDAVSSRMVCNKVLAELTQSAFASSQFSTSMDHGTGAHGQHFVGDTRGTMLLAPGTKPPHVV